MTQAHASELALLMRKIVRPSLPPTILQRQRLIAQLNETVSDARSKVVLISAPAGYGKTVLLTDFACQTSVPCCWYFLDAADRDPLTFFKHLLASICYALPHFKKKGLEQMLTQRTDLANVQFLEAYLHVLITTLQSTISERFLILLCNYHEVQENPIIHHWVQMFLQKMPLQCLFVIESRTIPEFEIARLIAQRELLGLGGSELRFTLQELQELVALQGMTPLSDEESTQLMVTFDGWIAGILLGTRLGSIQSLYASVYGQDSSFRQPERRHLFAYIVDEVFKQEPEVYAFLKEATVLHYMTPALCDALLDTVDATQSLHLAEQRNLLVFHTGEASQIIYHCHPLLRELFYEALRVESPERFIELHQRAARLLYAQRDAEMAIVHALEGGLVDQAVQWIVTAQRQLFLQGHLETITRWLNMLPEQVRVEHPRLLLIQTALALSTGDHKQAEVLLMAISTILANTSFSNDVLPVFRGEVALAHAKMLFQTGAYPEAQYVCQQALLDLPQDEIALRAEVYRYLGFCANLLGNFTTGIEYFQKALQHSGLHTTGQYVAEVRNALASSYDLLGNFALAEHHITQAIQYWEGVHDTWGKAHSLICLGLIQQRQGLLAEAEESFLHALTVARSSPPSPRWVAYALVDLGDLYQEQGKYHQSLTVVEEGLQLARTLKDNYLVNCSLCILAMTYTLMEDTATALLFTSEIQLPALGGEKPSYEHTLRDLTQSTILLYQQRYREATVELTLVRASWKRMGLQSEYLVTTLRLALCHLVCDDTPSASSLLKDAEKVVAEFHHYEHMMHVELSHLPTLLSFITTSEETADLRKFLHIIDEGPTLSPSLPTFTSHISGIKIQAFGDPMVFLAGKLVTSWHRAHAMELFFFLLDRGMPVRKEQIFVTLWPDEDESVDQILRVTIHYLRKALGESCIVTRRGTYALNLTTLYGTDIWYDVALFQQQYKQAGDAMKAKDMETAKLAFTAMVELYQGDFVPSFYSDWCRPRREAFRLMYLESLQYLAQQTWQEERFDESLDRWQQMLLVDGCLEEAHVGVMRCYLRMGKRGLALRQYQRCCTILQEEMNLEPGPTLQNFYERLTTTTESQNGTGKKHS